MAALIAAPELMARLHVLFETMAPGAARDQEARSFNDAAKVRVRRVVAALNGMDVKDRAAPWTEIPVILTREMADKLKAAILNEKVSTALDAQIGVDAASVLMGEIAAL